MIPLKIPLSPLSPLRDIYSTKPKPGWIQPSPLSVWVDYFKFMTMSYFWLLDWHPVPSLPWTLLHLFDLCFTDKWEAIRIKHPPLPTRFTNLPASISIFSLSYLWRGSSPLDFPTSLLHLSLFTLQQTLSSSLLPLTSKHALVIFHLILLWPPYTSSGFKSMHSFTTAFVKKLSSCVSLLPYPPQSLDSIPVRLSSPALRCLCQVSKLEWSDSFGREVNGLVRERGMPTQAARVKQSWWSMRGQIPMPDHFPF